MIYIGNYKDIFKMSQGWGQQGGRGLGQQQPGQQGWGQQQQQQPGWGQQGQKPPQQQGWGQQGTQQQGWQQGGQQQPGWGQQGTQQQGWQQGGQQQGWQQGTQQQNQGFSQGTGGGMFDQNRDYFIMTAVDDDMHLDVSQANDSTKFKLIIWKKNGDKNQRFRFREVGGGKYQIFSGIGATVEVPNNSAANGTQILAGQPNNATN